MSQKDCYYQVTDLNGSEIMEVISNVRSKEMLVQMREPIIRLKPPKTFRETAKTLEVVRSTNWYIVKNKDCIEQLSNTKRPEKYLQSI